WGGDDPLGLFAEVVVVVAGADARRVGEHLGPAIVEVLVVRHVPGGRSPRRRGADRRQPPIGVIRVVGLRRDAVAGIPRQVRRQAWAGLVIGRVLGLRRVRAADPGRDPAGADHLGLIVVLVIGVLRRVVADRLARRLRRDLHLGDLRVGVQGVQGGIAVLVGRGGDVTV